MPTETELFGKLINNDSIAGINENLPEYQQAKSRANDLNRLNMLSAQEIAIQVSGNKMLGGGQAMRDLKQFSPEKYQQVQEALKAEEELNTLNIISGAKTYSSEETLNAVDTNINEFISDKLTTQFGDQAGEAGTAFAEHLSSSSTIMSSREKMQTVAEKIGKLDDAIANLEKDARKRMGADTPEFLILDYVNNRGTGLQRERDSLLSQYNIYKSDFEREVEQEEKKWERDFKERQFAQQQSNDAFNQNYKLATMDGSGSYSTKTGMRTDRHGNPTAMTTDVARTLGLVEGVDYVQGDAFPNNPNLFTAKFLGDPMETTLKAFDQTASNPNMNIFYTQ